jgi:hypothetical protein
MDLPKLFLLPNVLKNNSKVTEHIDKEILHNSIFSQKVPRKIVIPLYSNLTNKPLLEILLHIVKNNPDFEVYFFSPRKQNIWMRKMFHSHNSPIPNLWEAFQHADTYRTKRDIFVYSWLFMNGGISVFPELIPKMSLYNIRQKTLPNTPFSVFFIEDGYLINDVLITTKNAPIFKKILEYCIHNILRNRSSSPIQRKVHLPDDSITGKFAMRKAFLDYISNPNFKIPSSGFKNDIITGLPIQLKHSFFQENKVLYSANQLLKQISIGYD